MSSDTTAKRRDASVCATMASLALRPDNARSMSLSASCLGKLPAHNTRAILFRRPAGQPVSPQTPRGSSSDSCARKPITGDFVEVVQSPDTAWTSTPLGDGACAFYYSPTSDTVTIENQGKDPIRIASVRDDGSLTENGIVLRGFAHAKFTPGSWRILSGYDEEDPVVLADLLLFHRRYIVIKEGRVSSTRQNRSNSETLVGRMGADETWRQSAVNPLAGLQKGQSLTIMPDESFACPKKAAGYQRGEVYTLRHTGNITDAKMLATLFGAHHSDLGSTAVKVVRERGAPSWSMPCLADMWRGEEGILRKLDHTNIVKILGSDARLHAIYMEFLPFSDLGKWTRSQKEDKPGTFTGTVKDAVRVLGDMASALAYLSKQRILHNDVKPDNIIYDGGGPRGAVLVDFGLATHCGHRTQGGSCWYIPPECLDDMFREPPSDVFALGVTMLFLLGQMPLPEDSWPDWDIDNISRNTADAMDMKAWLEHLDVLAADMGDSVASDTVRDTLLDVPEDRVSAEEIVRRLNEAGMLPGTSGGEGS